MSQFPGGEFDQWLTAEPDHEPRRRRTPPRSEAACESYAPGVLVGTATPTPYRLCKHCQKPPTSHAHDPRRR
jgi:hypothetical protein